MFALLDIVPRLQMHIRYGDAVLEEYKTRAAALPGTRPKPHTRQLRHEASDAADRGVDMDSQPALDAEWQEQDTNNPLYSDV